MNSQSFFWIEPANDNFEWIEITEDVHIIWTLPEANDNWNDDCIPF